MCLSVHIDTCKFLLTGRMFEQVYCTRHITTISKKDRAILLPFKLVSCTPIPCQLT
jgi:hypothetical protein